MLSTCHRHPGNIHGTHVYSLQPSAERWKTKHHHEAALWTLEGKEVRGIQGADLKVARAEVTGETGSSPHLKASPQSICRLQRERIVTSWWKSLADTTLPWGSRFTSPEMGHVNVLSAWHNALQRALHLCGLPPNPGLHLAMRKHQIT